MKIIAKSQRKEIKNADSCTAFEYLIGDRDINAAIIKLNGRYPEKGMATNEISKEIGYVLSGSGKVAVDGKEFIINQGDLILINPGEKYYWEGNMELFIPCVPAWTPEQHKIIE